MNRKVLFHLLTIEEGGRHSPIILGYRPELNIGDNKLKSFFTIKEEEEVSISLGETKEIEIQFFVEDWIPELNKEYLVQEGGHVVGNLTFI